MIIVAIGQQNKYILVHNQITIKSQQFVMTLAQKKKNSQYTLISIERFYK